MGSRFGWLSLLVALLLGCSSEEISPVPVTSGGGSGGAAGQGGDVGGGGGGGGAEPTECDLLGEELDAALAAAVADQTIPGAAAEVRSGDCVWQGAAGVADLEASTPLAPDDLFRVGSITKSFASTVVVMLSVEGALGLDDPISDYVSDVPNGDNITIRHVLSHTSGLYNMTDDPTFFDDPDRVWTPAEMVAFATAHPPSFDPGQGWEYSNTGYIIVGMIIEDVTGSTAAAEIRSRILDPLALSSTYLDGSEPAVPGLVKGYSDAGVPDYVDITHAFDPSAAWTAGAMVSTTTDLNTFYDALLTGGLVEPAALSEMMTFVPAGGGVEYGLGLFRLPTPLGPVVGHSGGIWGFLSESRHTPDSELDISVLINSSSDNVGAVNGALVTVLIEAG